MSRVRITKVQVEGFRGFKKKMVLDFDYDYIFLFGPNGVGKSSLLDAIEFGLFGEVAHLSGIEFTRTKDELVNIFSKVARVELEINDEKGNHYHIIRQKKPRRMKTDLTVNINNKEFTDLEAQRKIESALKLTIDDFYSSVYLHQGLLRQIISGSPSERADAFDSLLGLRNVKEIIDSLPTSELEKQIMHLEARMAKIEGEIIGAAGMLRKELKGLKADIKRRGFTAEVSESAVFSYVQDLVNQLNRLADVIGVRQKEVVVAGISIRTVRSAIPKIRNYAKYISKGLPRSLRRLEERTRKFDESASFISRLRNELDALSKERQAIVTQYGNEVAIRNALDRLSNYYSKSVEEYENMSATYAFLKYGLELLRKSEQDKCPLCSSRIERQKIIDMTENTLKVERYEKRLNQLQNRIRELDQEKAALKVAQEKIISIDHEVGTIMLEAGRRYGTAMNIEVEMRHVSVDEDDARLFKAIEELSVEREKTKKKMNEIEKETDEGLELVENELLTLELLIQLLDKKMLAEDLTRAIPRSYKDQKTIRKELKALYAFQKDIGTIRKTLVSARRYAARELITKFAEHINRIYTKFNPHTYYNKLSVELRRGMGRLEYFYLIKALNPYDRKDTTVRSRFSQAQMNMVALSIFFALSLGPPHNLDFIILDEPDQSLDTTQKQRLIEALADLQIQKQIVVASQDGELHDMVVERLAPSTKGGVVHEFKRWDVKEGPKIETHGVKLPKLLISTPINENVTLGS